MAKWVSYSNPESQLILAPTTQIWERCEARDSLHGLENF